MTAASSPSGRLDLAKSSKQNAGEPPIPGGKAQRPETPMPTGSGILGSLTAPPVACKFPAEAGETAPNHRPAEVAPASAAPWIASSRDSQCVRIFQQRSWPASGAAAIVGAGAARSSGARLDESQRLAGFRS